MRTRPFVLVAVLAFAFVACNDIPVKGLNESYRVQIKELRDKGKPAKLDILWVVDDSPSMCQEQQSLARSFASFLEVFQKYTAIDMRLAVTTTNVSASKKAGANRGKFVYQPPVGFPLDCIVKRVEPCLTDAQCQQIATEEGRPDPTNWVCDEVDAAKMYSCDRPEALGSPDKWEGDVLFAVRSQCRYRCDRTNNPGGCAMLFGQPDGCSALGGGSETSMCTGGICNVSACETNSTLGDITECEDLCRDSECVDVCLNLLTDSSTCEARCTAGTCVSVCQSLSKTEDCSAVCASDWATKEVCAEYLGDTLKCEDVVASGDCYGTCKSLFTNQDFLCNLVCDSGYECEQRCVAEFGESDFRCVVPGGSDMDEAGCMEPPPTANCPGELTTVGDTQYFVGGPKVLDREVSEKYMADWINGLWRGDPNWNESWKTALAPLIEADEDTKDRDNLWVLVRQKVFEQLFLCMATVGAQQNIWGNQEQGLRAAWMALDPAGENAAQAQAFLRDGAYLLVVVVSDEEDCSAPDDPADPLNANQVSSEDYGSCGCLRDEDGCVGGKNCDYTQCLGPSTGTWDPAWAKAIASGEFNRFKCPLYAPATVINKLRSLKADPAQVVFAAIAGAPVLQSTTTPAKNEDDVDVIEDRFYDCKCDPAGLEAGTAEFNYVCLSDTGKADLGARYAAVANGFGNRYGQLANICAQEGIEPSLEEIANLVIPLLTQVCLPRPLEWDCQGKCETIYGDDAACRRVCELPEECRSRCTAEFQGAPGCLDVCAAGEYVEVYKYDENGECVRKDETGKCLPLTQITDENPDGDYYLVTSAPNCEIFDREEGDRLINAIQFKEPLEYLDKLEIGFRSDSFACTERCEPYFTCTDSEGRLLADVVCAELCSMPTDECMIRCLDAAARDTTSCQQAIPEEQCQTICS